MATNVIIKETNKITEEQVKYIKELKTSFIDKYKQIKDEKENLVKYQKLSNKLNSFHKSLTHNVLVPIVKHPTTAKPLCLMEGRVYHTNEVFVPLSSVYYAKMSTSDAAVHCGRKIEEIEENILELDDQKKAFLEKIVFLEDALQPGQVEIIEEYPEDYEVAGSRRNVQKKKTDGGEEE